jgi:UDP-N-acetyl-D-glucosamine/UDP-N-acetyl-D-galactosamine dehydrogenase
MNYKICVIGLGYVGLPLAIAFAEKFKVVGLDVDKNRINELRSGFDRTLEVDKFILSSVKKSMTFSTDIQDTKSCNVYIVTVPTPVGKDNRPNLKPLIESSRAVGTVLNKNDIVIYESTVYPGVTEEVCVPELEYSSEMKFNEDFYCGYSPERINPGDKERMVTKILKVTSGSTPEIAKEIDALYKKIIKAGTYLASSIKVAEASKVIENTQRDVNIALINELALIFDQMDIDTNEVIEAAATKWNFIKLSPGLVGGHCIGVDPYYLSFRAEEVGYKPNLILTARQINNGMSKFIADKTIKEMILAGKTIKGSKVLILGFAFKEDCPDTRNTKVLEIVGELKGFGINVDIYDPWVEYVEHAEWLVNRIIENPLKADKRYDAIVVAVGHKQFKKITENDYIRLSTEPKVVIDVKNIVVNPTWRL